MAGLAAARAMAACADRVLVLERDDLAGPPGPRKGVPQSRHTHALMMRGQAHLEEWFPGLSHELASYGALAIDPMADLKRIMPYGLAPRFRSDLELLLVSRDLLEWSVRQRVRRLGNVELRGGCAANGPLVSAAGERVCGVELEDGQRVTARLVIDATGRASAAPRWLQALGRTEPRETIVNAHWGYASRFYAKPAGWSADWRMAGVVPGSATGTRGGVVAELDGDRFIVTLMGAGRDYPPTDEDGFASFAADVAMPDVARVVSTCKPLTSIAGSRSTTNRWRHYEELSDQPDGFVVIGDAVAAFNPAYGQGMTLAAIEAHVLQQLWRADPAAGNGTAGFSRRYQRALARTIRFPWLLAVGADTRFEGADGPSLPWAARRLAMPYLDRVVALTSVDRRAACNLERTIHLTRSPSWMVHPRIAARVVAGWRKWGSHHTPLPDTQIQVR